MLPRNGSMPRKDVKHAQHTGYRCMSEGPPEADIRCGYALHAWLAVAQHGRLRKIQDTADYVQVHHRLCASYRFLSLSILPKLPDSSKARISLSNSMTPHGGPSTAPQASDQPIPQTHSRHHTITKSTMTSASAHHGVLRCRMISVYRANAIAAATCTTMPS